MASMPLAGDPGGGRVRPGRWMARGVIAGSVLAVALTSLAAPGAGVATAAAGQPGPFVTLMFSRTEITAADACRAADTGIARLDTAVAPYLATQGYAGVGTLVTGVTRPATPTCTHSRSTLMASWADASSLATTYGWSFVSHTATYPPSTATLTDAQARAESCGSAETLEQHGLPGARGLIAYPGAQAVPTSIQGGYGALCFAWGRRYLKTGTTSVVAATTPPYWQNTKAMNGGPCNSSGQACYTITATGSKRYDLPSSIVSRVQSLGPGQWLTIQVYVLVAGRSPAYSASRIRWDCTAADPRLHWTNDNERYCYRDWQQIVAAVVARPDIVVTDPLTVGVAFGRPATYP